MKYEKSCGCIIIKDNKVLLVQHNEGHWDFQKGHMEENETEMQTAIREVKEETNLDVLVQKDKRYIIEYYPKEDTFKQVIFFLGMSKTKETKKQESEIKNIEWLSFEDAIKRITYNSSKELLRQVIKDININKKTEVWDIYDKNKKKTGKTAIRGIIQLKEGEYHRVVEAIILNSKNEFLITKRAAHKTFPFMWECNGGSVLAGETSLEGIIRELKEELGIQFSKKDAILFKEMKREEMHDIKDLWLFKKDINIQDINFPDKEAIEAKWVTIEKFKQMYSDKEIIQTQNYIIEDYEKILKSKQNENYKYIGKIVNVKRDRPFGSKHPKHGFIYPVNYGYIPNTISSDGEELDCYILGEFEPLEEFKGKCIALIHRTNDNDDKLIIVPEGKIYTNEQIRALTEFQEQYFESEIIN